MNDPLPPRHFGRRNMQRLGVMHVRDVTRRLLFADVTSFLHVYKERAALQRNWGLLMLIGSVACRDIVNTKSRHATISDFDNDIVKRRVPTF